MLAIAIFGRGGGRIKGENKKRPVNNLLIKNCRRRLNGGGEEGEGGGVEQKRSGEKEDFYFP